MATRAVVLLGLISALPALAAGQEFVRVRVNGRVDSVPLERYVEGVVASEVYASWPEEVLKAQAVVARTYALHESSRRRGEPYDLESSVLSQAYGTREVTPSVRQAARLTRGEYLAWRGEPVLSVFHSAAGGRTASAEEVWGEALPYLRSVASPDDTAPHYFWSYEIAESELVDLLRDAGYPVTGDGGVGAAQLSDSGRVERVEIAGAPVSGRQLRELLGTRAIRSTLFELRSGDGRVRFLGSGAGHGVGLSQWGARELALRRQSYRQILAHYYPGTSLRLLEGERTRP